MSLSTKIPSRNDPDAFFDAMAQEQRRQDQEVETYCQGDYELRIVRQRAWQLFISVFLLTVALGLLVIALFGCGSARPRPRFNVPVHAPHPGTRR